MSYSETKLLSYKFCPTRELFQTAIVSSLHVIGQKAPGVLKQRRLLQLLLVANQLNIESYC